MDDLIKNVRSYQQAGELADRSQFAEAIFREVEPKISQFVFGVIRSQLADDVLQEALMGIIKSFHQFSGTTGEDFLRWCRGVARHKIHDQYQDSAKASERFQMLPPDELLEQADLTPGNESLSAGDRLDLDYAMKLLAESKPECGEPLRKHFVFGFDYGEIAEELKLDYDTARMRIKRCLDTVRELVA